MDVIYTHTGDEGMTGLRGTARVPKDHPRVEANGTIDELTSFLGVVRANPYAPKEMKDMIHEVQKMLMTLMGQIAIPAGSGIKPVESKVFDDMTLRIEAEIDRIKALGTPQGFTMPGCNPLEAQLHVARAVARRAERRLWTVHFAEPIDTALIRMVNRLSDLLYTYTLVAGA